MAHDIIILDMETQYDFFHPSGHCYTPQATAVAKNIYTLIRSARRRHVPVLSTVLRVRPGQLGPMATIPHCIEDTPGEQKMTRTLLARRIDLGLRNVTDLPPAIFTQYSQVIVEKRDTNIFTHARIERLITEASPATFIICGAGVGQGIVQAAIGLRSRGFSVIVARDAVLTTDGPAYMMPVERMEAKGAVLLDTQKIILPPRPSAGAHRREHPLAGRLAASRLLW